MLRAKILSSALPHSFASSSPCDVLFLTTRSKNGAAGHGFCGSPARSATTGIRLEGTPRAVTSRAFVFHSGLLHTLYSEVQSWPSTTRLPVSGWQRLPVRPLLLQRSNSGYGMARNTASGTGSATPPEASSSVEGETCFGSLYIDGESPCGSTRRVRSFPLEAGSIFNPLPPGKREASGQYEVHDRRRNLANSGKGIA